MSAYGAIQKPNRSSQILPSTKWQLGSNSPAEYRGYVTIHHVTLAAVQKIPDLLDCLCSHFTEVIDDGMTYPQEGPMNMDAFKSYFFSGDVFVAIFEGSTTSDDANTTLISSTDKKPSSVSPVELNITDTRQERTWYDAVAGFYYIKPNYPGRSSHICNGGLVVPARNRNRGCGFALASSYIHYAPLLGYKGSVFNLVYANNHASLRLWERLGFTKIGSIPQAGRLKKRDGDGEEYVDAWVIYKSFENV